MTPSEWLDDVQAAVTENVAVDPFTIRMHVPHQLEQECPHQLIRALNDGHCILCDGPLPLSIDEELELLEEEEKEAAAELAQLDADAASLELSEFVRQGWHVLEPYELEWNWHHEALCRNVQGMLEEWLKRKDDRSYVMRFHKLCINICPSSLKSRIIMVFAPAWIWLRCPTFAWLCVSANPANVTRDADACRDLITSKWYRETFNVTWTIREDINSKAKFKTTAGGERINRGLIAKFTGIHVDGILIDDPDDAKDVHSDAARKERSGKIEAISSRLNDKRHYIMIITQQRVHVDDCTGELLSRGGDMLQASYPVLYSSRLRRDSPFFTDPRSVDGENMHAERFTLKVLAEARVELGTHGFEAQYNQNPAPLDGGMFGRGWFRYFRIHGKEVGLFSRPKDTNTDDAVVLEVDANGRPKLDWLAISVDATFGGIKETNSAVGLLVVGGRGPKRYVFMDRTKQRTYIDTKKAIRQLLQDYPAALSVLIEKKANGAAIIEELSAEFSGLIGLEANEHYISRAYAMSPAIESGSIFLLDGEQWLEEFVGEICLFPNGTHDDRVDALSQLLAHFRADTDVMKLQARNEAFKVIAKQNRFGMARKWS